MRPSVSSRSSEPTGRREAPPDDRLRERDPGPITTNAHVARSWSDDLVYDWHRWLWVTAFAGGTTPSAPRGLLAIRQMHRAVAAGRMRGQFGGGDIVGGHRGSRRLRRHRFLHAAVLRGLILRRDVIQDRRQPALGFRHAPAFSRRIILDLVPLDLADAEVKAFGMAEIKPGYRRARPHRKTLRQLHAGGVFRVEQGKQRRLLGVIRLSEIARRR